MSPRWSQLSLDGPDQVDHEIEQVVQWLRQKATQEKIGQAIRGAIDSVLDGVHTGRYSLNQLDRTEKTYIGTKVEHFILHVLELDKTPPLDTMIKKIPVDIKFTIKNTWMIPPEAFGKICVLVSADEDRSVFSFGVVRTQEEWLNKPNRDQKGSLSAEGKSHATWLHEDAPLPENFLYHLPDKLLKKILSKPRGQQRVTEVFRQVQGQLVNLTAVDTLGRQRDASKRVRQARKDLRAEGIAIYSIRYNKVQLNAHGLSAIAQSAKDGWVAVRTSG